MSFENVGNNNQGSEIESEDNAEIVELLTKLDEGAEEAGLELADTDFIKIGEGESMQLQGRLEMIFSALAIVAGLKIAFGSMPSLTENTDTIEAIVSRLGQVAVAAGGTALFFAGVRKFDIGYKRFLGYIRMKELRDLKN